MKIRGKVGIMGMTRFSNFSSKLICDCEALRLAAILFSGQTCKNRGMEVGLATSMGRVKTLTPRSLGPVRPLGTILLNHNEKF